jgi:hypothetical protein
MAARWSFFTFDWPRFRAISPRLQDAVTSADFTQLGLEDVSEVLDTLDEETSPETVANVVIAHLCSGQEVALFEAGLPEMILWLRKQPHGEEVGEQLGELLSAEPHIEDWFRSDGGLIGILTEEETVSLDSAFTYFRKTYNPPSPLRGLASLTRRFSAADPAKEHLSDLMDVVAQAAGRHAGLGVLRED